MAVKYAPIAKIKATLGIQPDGPVLKYFMNTAYRRMGKYVPGGSSSRLNKTVRFKGNILSYESPYAHYQYIGKLYVMKNGKGAYFSEDYGFWSDKGQKKTATARDLNHPSGGGPYWAEEMMSAEGHELTKDVEKYVRRRL